MVIVTRVGGCKGIGLCLVGERCGECTVCVLGHGDAVVAGHSNFALSGNAIGGDGQLHGTGAGEGGLVGGDGDRGDGLVDGHSCRLACCGITADGNFHGISAAVGHISQCQAVGGRTINRRTVLVPLIGSAGCRSVGGQGNLVTVDCRCCAGNGRLVQCPLGVKHQICRGRKGVSGVISFAITIGFRIPALERVPGTGKKICGSICNPIFSSCDNLGRFTSHIRIISDLYKVVGQIPFGVINSAGFTASGGVDSVSVFSQRTCGTRGICVPATKGVTRFHRCRHFVCRKSCVVFKGTAVGDSDVKFVYFTFGAIDCCAVCKF